MFRCISGSLVALITIPLISAAPAPATLPQTSSRDEIRDLQRRLDEVQKELNAAGSALNNLSKLPPIRPWGPEQIVPAQPGMQGQFELKPYGQPFKLNGLTVYVEPISLAERRR